MQLLTETSIPDVAAFKSAFDADAERRMNAGLTLLQMWRAADNDTQVLCLFKVNDRARAQNWMDSESAGDANFSGRFLDTM